MEKNKAKEIIKNDFVKEKLLPFLAQNFNLISLGAALIVLILGIWIIILPKYRELTKEDLSLSLEDQQIDYEKNKETFEELKKIQANYQAIKKEDLEKIEKILPKSDNNEDLLILVENIIKNKGGLVSSLSIEEAVDNDSISQSGIESDFAGEAEAGLDDGMAAADGGASDLNSTASSASSGSPDRIGKVKISAEAIGIGYSNLKPLLEGFESSLRIMDIKNIDFDPEGEKVSFEVIAYYLKN